MTSVALKKRLGDLFIFKNGRAFKKEEWSTIGLPIIRIQNLNNSAATFNYFAGDYSSDILVQYGDLLFSWSGTVGTSFGPHLWAGEDGLLNQHIFKIGFKKASIIKQYAYYALFHITEEIEQSVNGAVGLVHVTKEKLNEFTIPVPPLAEQERIAAILDEACDSIATARANAEQNLQNARTLFNSHLEAVFTKPSKKWVEKLLGEVCDLVGGSQPPKATFERNPSDENIRFIQIRDYKSDRHTVYIPRKLARRFCSEDDVMIGRYGPPIFQILKGLEGAYNVALIKAVPDVSQLSRDYLFYFLKHPSIQEYVIFHSERAAGQTGLNKERLEPYPIRIPSLAEQEKIVTITREIEIETQRLETLYQRKLAALDNLKKTLLHQAFSGQL